MSVIDELLEANRTATEGAGAPRTEVPAMPSRAVAIVTCMDCRIDLGRALGLGIGEAHVLRNAGGSVTDDVIRSLALSQHKLGTTAVMVVHHDKCGLSTVTDDGFRAELLAASGVAPAFAIESFTDVEEDVRQSVRRVRNSPFLPHRDEVRGFVYDVDTHALREVAVDEGGAGGGGDPDRDGAPANPPGEEVI